MIHQPIPVSPREPSLLFGLGAPIVIGPMNGAWNIRRPSANGEACSSKSLSGSGERAQAS